MTKYLEYDTRKAHINYAKQDQDMTQHPATIRYGNKLLKALIIFRLGFNQDTYRSI